MEFNDKYDKQMISVDVSIFSIINNELNVLLIKRNKEPFNNQWSLIGGGVYNDETLENAVKRELKEKTSIEGITPILSNVFSKPDRDIRFRNISISYYCLSNNIEFSVSDKTSEIKWFPINQIPQLAFDHNEILSTSINQLKNKVYDIEFIKPHFPEQFTLSSLQSIYESILNTHLDKRNFRRKLNSMNCLLPTGIKNESDSHRKSEIYKFK